MHSRFSALRFSNVVLPKIWEIVLEKAMQLLGQGVDVLARVGVVLVPVVAGDFCNVQRTPDFLQFDEVGNAHQLDGAQFVEH